MHVLSISPRFSINGVTVHVDRLNEELVRAGHRVTSIPLSTTEPIVEQHWHDRKRRWTPAPVLGGDWFDEKLRLVDAAIETLVSECAEPVDLIHSHDWLAGHAGVLLAETLGCRHLTTIHTLTELQRQEAGLPGRLPAHAGQIRLEKRLCSEPDAILTVSRALRSKIETLAPASSRKIEVVPNGLASATERAPERAAVDTLRHRFAPDGQSIVLFVGRLAPQKGLDFLLASSFAVRRRRPNTVWVVVGDHVASHMMRPVYRQILEQAESSDHVRFVGEVPHEEVELYYRASDCLILPSLYEGCPYVALEAMRAGVPIVASDLPDLREILTDRENALLVPLDQSAPTRGPRVDSLARAQLELLDDPALRGALAEHARRTVGERFPLERQMNGTFELYRRLVAPDAVRTANTA